MFIIWGSKETSKIVGKVQKNFTCNHCNNTTPFQIVKNVKWFTLYFIPVFPLNSDYRAECPICRYGFDIDKRRAEEIIAEMKNQN